MKTHKANTADWLILYSKHTPGKTPLFPNEVHYAVNMTFSKIFSMINAY